MIVAARPAVPRIRFGAVIVRTLASGTHWGSEIGCSLSDRQPARPASRAIGRPQEPFPVGRQDPPSGFVGTLMFPNADHLPAEFSQASVGVAIPFLVLTDFLPPPRGIGLWLGAMSRAAVPETTV